MRVSAISGDAGDQPTADVAATLTAATSALCRTQVHLEEHPRTTHSDLQGSATADC